jgi:uncharacterized membrane protein HdeD (DUF308 family)
MKTIRLLAGFLLLISGVLHFVVYFQAPQNPGSIGILVFGLIYCITGLLLFNRRKYPLYLGIFVPFIGMTLSLIKFGIPEVISLSALFKFLEIIAVVICCFLFLSSRNGQITKGTEAALR